MRIISIRTKAFLPPKDDIFPTLKRLSKRLQENDVVVVTSKVVSIGEGRCLPVGTTKEKERLVRKEADAIFGEKGVMLTLKEYTVVAWAGIDESNAKDHWILWPKDSTASAKAIRSFLRRESGIKNLGVIITDSHFIPLRAGAVGVSIGSYGFRPVVSYVGKKDIFGRKLKYTTVNVADGVAAAAVAVMGETNEQVPIVIARDVPRITFTTTNARKELYINPKKDIYYPLLKPLI